MGKGCTEMKVKEVIVVEGKHDTQRLQKFVECDTLETGGLCFDPAKLKLIRLLQQERGVIIFTDPDGPGEKIRNAINQSVPGCKNAFIARNKAKTTKKVGVEHAAGEDIIEALTHLMTYEENPKQTLSWSEFMALGLSGQANSQKVREMLGNTLFIGKCNGKTLWKRLNMLGLHCEQVAALLDAPAE